MLRGACSYIFNNGIDALRAADDNCSGLEKHLIFTIDGLISTETCLHGDWYFFPVDMCC